MKREDRLNKNRLNEFVDNRRRICVTCANPVMSISGRLLTIRDCFSTDHFKVANGDATAVFRASQVSEIRESKIPEIVIERSVPDEEY